jgi:hypothetical protein
MKKIFEQFKNMLVVHPKYKGHVCGYTDSHIILAVETKDDKNFFRKMENPYIMEEYKDIKYRYVFEDERELIKQFNNGAWHQEIDIKN